MIQSLLDNDLYKFTMQQAVLKLYPQALAQYDFIERNEIRFPEGFDRRLRDQVDRMADLRLTREEKSYLSGACPYFTQDFLDFLESFVLNPEHVEIKQQGSRLSVTVKGPWIDTIPWEVPLMAVISELYFKMTGAAPVSRSDQEKRNREKARVLAREGIRFAEFGTRRRFSSTAHHNLIHDLTASPDNTFAGTSNVFLARTFGTPPVGTVAHEWFMFHGALYGYKNANEDAMDTWTKVYGQDLSIILTDTYTTGIFLPAFDRYRAGLFDGVRQDSGDPLRFTDRMIRHYEGLGIDPSTKQIVYSDGLDVARAVQIHTYCRGRIMDLYGIGTSLSNDVGVNPLNMVIKLTRCRADRESGWHPTVKLSDVTEKRSGHPDELKRCLKELELG